MPELEQFRAEKNDFYKHHRQSPLTPEQKQEFTGLSYFPENDALRLDVKVELFDDVQPVTMQTTIGGIQLYFRHGRFRFSVEGQEAELTIYKSEHGYFLPFVDSLGGSETYPSGRYLEPEELPGNHFLVDFNIAYNPYCAYNEMWSCPLTPWENRLMVPIRAGEKIYHE